MTEMIVGPACVSALFYNREIQGGHIGPPLQNFFGLHLRKTGIIIARH